MTADNTPRPRDETLTTLWRIEADGGRYSMAAMTPEQAGDDVARILRAGDSSVTVERFEGSTLDDLNDAWGDSRWLAARGVSR